MVGRLFIEEEGGFGVVADALVLDARTIADDEVQTVAERLNGILQ